MILPIYLDYAATTPLDPRVAERMSECLTLSGNFANPASLSHVYGRRAKEIVDMSRSYVAELIHAEPSEIIWTSGATEANNLAIKGVAELYQSKGKHIVTLKTEHKAVLDSCQYLEKKGFPVTYLTPEKTGRLDLDKFSETLRDDTILVSVMHVNNEIGVIQDLKSIGEITRARGILLHVDAAQSAGKIPIDLRSLPVDLMAFSAHKIYGPKGMGALYVRQKPRVRVAAQMHGGGHEQGMRSGTLATHQIVGMGEACRIAKFEMHAEQEKIRALRQRFLNGLAGLGITQLNGDVNHCLPGIINISFVNLKNAELLSQLEKQIAASVGSACDSSNLETSYVLRALGVPENLARSAIRFSLGRFTTAQEIDAAVTAIKEVLT